MKRVAIVRSDYPVISEPFITEQLNNMSTWESIVLRRRAGNGSESVSICETVNSLRGKLIGLWPYVAARKHVMAAEKCNLVHAHFGPDGVYARTIALEVKKPYIVTFHGYDATLSDEALMRTLQPSKLHYLAMRRSVLKDASLLIAVSDFIKSKLIGLGASHEKVVRHYIGVDINKFYGKPKQKQSSSIQFISVARLVYSKALDVAIRAVAAILNMGVDCRYDIVGDGPLRSELEALVHSLGIEDRVSFLGALPHENVVSKLQDVDVFLFPSRPGADGAEEALGISLLEASACGIPIVACDVGGIGEVVRDGVNGYLVSYWDQSEFVKAIYRLIDNPLERARFGAAGRELVEAEFNIAQQGNLLERLYESVT